MPSTALNIRCCTHAGSWYTDDPSQLRAQLTQWLADAPARDESTHVRAIIAPHAGYSYSGPTAAYAYKQLKPERIKRVFVLGPSHHVYLKGCALPGLDTYATPLGDIPVDKGTLEALYATGQFEQMRQSVDEDEHSIEMHLPYLVHVMEGQAWSIVPVLVGALDTAAEERFGALFADFLNDPGTLFVASSDFCHWGRRFQYQHYDESKGAIYQSIEHLDKWGMQLIEEQKTKDFAEYLQSTGNTICGRHPISVRARACLRPRYFFCSAVCG